MNETNTCTPDRRTVFQRLVDRLFPSAPSPGSELPEWASDAIYTHCRVTMSWADRLRVLVSGRYMVQTQTTVQFHVGRCESQSVGYALAPDNCPPSPEGAVCLGTALVVAAIGFGPPHGPWTDLQLGLLTVLQLLRWLKTR